MRDIFNMPYGRATYHLLPLIDSVKKYTPLGSILFGVIYLKANTYCLWCGSNLWAKPSVYPNTYWNVTILHPQGNQAIAPIQIQHSNSSALKRDQIYHTHGHTLTRASKMRMWVINVCTLFSGANWFIGLPFLSSIFPSLHKGRSAWPGPRKERTSESQIVAICSPSLLLKFSNVLWCFLPLCSALSFPVFFFLERAFTLISN